MNEGLKMIVVVTGGAMLFPLAVVAGQTPSYIPSNRLRVLAERAEGPTLGREALADELGSCRRGRRARIRVPVAEIGAYPLHAWQNDAGYFATTRLHCVAGQRCTVEAAAWIAHPVTGTRCDGGPIAR